MEVSPKQTSMKKYFVLIFSVFILTSTYSQDRGCPGSYLEYYIVTPDSINSIVDKTTYCGGFYMTGAFPSFNDTLEVSIFDNETVEVHWSAVDRYDRQYSDHVIWYKDGLDLPQSYFQFSCDSLWGDCYNPTSTSTSIELTEPGLYYMNAPGLPARIDYILITKKEDPIVDSIDFLPQVNIEVYPNPAAEILNIHHGSINDGEIIIYDIQGKIVKEYKANSDLLISRISITEFESGYYILSVSTDTHGLVQKKFQVIK